MAWLIGSLILCEISLLCMVWSNGSVATFLLSLLCLSLLEGSFTTCLLSVSYAIRLMGSFNVTGSALDEKSRAGSAGESTLFCFTFASLERGRRYPWC